MKHLIEYPYLEDTDVAVLHFDCEVIGGYQTLTRAFRRPPRGWDRGEMGVLANGLERIKPATVRSQPGALPSRVLQLPRSGAARLA